MLINFSKVKTSVGAKFEVKRPLATGNFSNQRKMEEVLLKIS